MMCEGIKPDWVAYVSLFEALSVTNDLALLSSYYEKGITSGVIRPASKDSNNNTIVVDLNGWSAAMSRTALRHVMKDIQKDFKNGVPLKGMAILTGKKYSKGTQQVLRPAIAHMLDTEYGLKYDAHSSGKITIERDSILNWLHRRVSSSS